MAIEIPAPGPGDSDQVVSSLENAALFGRIGDPVEALRWLQRAAESASESGDDVRTLTLARTAAELSGSLRPTTRNAILARAEAEASGERLVPRPPPAAHPTEPTPAEALAEAPADASNHDEPTLLLTRPAQHKPESQRAPELTPEAAAVRPPPPSSRPLASRPPAPSSRHLPAPTGTPTPPSVAAPSVAAPSVAAPSVATPTAAAAALTTATPATTTPLAVPFASPSPAPWRPARVRQAARVSVEKSKTEPGLFLVRMLDEGTSPEAGRSEALLVSIDPGVGFF